MVEVVQKLSEKILAAIQTGNLQTVDSLISNNAVFVHMGVCLDKKGEFEAIEKGLIAVQKIDIAEEKTILSGATTIILRKLQLTAVVQGNEVTNPFVVAETYTKDNAGNWLLMVNDLYSYRYRLRRLSYFLENALLIKKVILLWLFPLL